jgi:hypothetical protein
VNQPSLAERLRYRFDNFMARGTIAPIREIDSGAVGADSPPGYSERYD